MSVQFHRFLEDGDSVGVITVEGVKAGQELTGWIMKRTRPLRSRFSMTFRSDTRSLSRI